MNFCCKSISFLTILLLCLTVLNASPLDISSWPKLPTHKYIKGKSALKIDVDEKRAVFAYLRAATSSTPINILIPQYGLLKTSQSDKQLRIIVIQAESFNGMNMLGYIDIQTGIRAITLMKNVKLLGDMSKKPGLSLPRD